MPGTCREVAPRPGRRQRTRRRSHRDPARGASPGAKIKSNGTFKVSSEGDSSNGLATYELRGKVKGSKLSGSIEQFFRNGCQTFDLKFTAKRR